jgi:hypothetical protein
VTLPSEEWLPLLQRLTSISESWGVWKNADRALAGHGDVDSVAPTDEHLMLRAEFAAWAAQGGFRWLVQCEHAGGILVLIALQDSRWAQLDLVFETPFRGTRLFSAEQLRPLMVLDERGFRRVREGAEGLFLFLYKGIRWGGRPDWANISKYQVVDKMHRDWGGAEAASRLLGPARDPLLRAARHAVAGEWAAAPLLQAEALMLMRALKSPRIVASRAIARGWSLPRCVVAKAIATGRRPEPLEEWLQQARFKHDVAALTPEQPFPS